MSDQAFDLRHLGLGALPKAVDPAFYDVSRYTGLGQVFKKDPKYVGSGVTSGGGVQINPIHHVIAGSWVPLGTIDSSGNFKPNDPTGQFSKFSDLQDTLNNWATNIVQLAAAGSKYGGYYYFGLSDTNNGGAQTLGEPAGMAIMRYGKGQLSMCTGPASIVVQTLLPTALPTAAPVATAPATDNTIWWVLLGVTVLGVGGYILLD